MTGDPTSLSVCLGLEPASPGDNTFTEARLRDLEGHLRQALEGSPLVPQSISPSLAREVIGALRRPLTDTLIGAWNARKEIRKFADATVYPPEEVHEVSLKTHTINQTIHPSLEISLNEKHLVTLKVDAAVHVNVEGATLVIRGGRVMALRLGPAKVSGEITTYGAKLLELTSRPYQLPGEIPLGEGIRIPPP